MKPLMIIIVLVAFGLTTSTLNSEFDLITYSYSRGNAGFGDSCTAATDCLSGICTANVCVSKTLGAVCAKGVECISGVCTSGKCADAKSVGEACADNSECSSNICGTDKKCSTVKKMYKRKTDNLKYN